MARRTFGWVLTVIAVFAAAWQLAYHRDVIDRLGGIGGLIGAIAFVAVGVLVVYWPDRWGTTGRRFFTAVALVAFLFGGDFIKEAFAEAPGWTAAGLAGGVLALIVLYSLTVVDTTPRWLHATRARLAPLPAP